MSQPVDWSEIAAKVYEHWGVKPRPASRSDVGKLLSITIGLEALFRDADAERHWMHLHHDALNDSPWLAIRAGRIDDVLNLVNRERNLG